MMYIDSTTLQKFDSKFSRHKNGCNIGVVEYTYGNRCREVFAIVAYNDSLCITIMLYLQVLQMVSSLL